jgi:ribosomal protein L7/L12
MYAMDAQVLIPDSVISFLAVVIAFLLKYVYNHFNQQNARTARLERKVDRIMEHLGLQVDNKFDDVLQLVRSGQKILAIKHYRELTGAGLKEAKDAVEFMEKEEGM